MRGDPTQRTPGVRARGAGNGQRRADNIDKGSSPSLFDPVAAPDLDRARRLRDDGLRVAVQATHPGWRAAAERELEALAASGLEFTADDLTERVGHALASSPNAVGSLFGQASKAGLIRCVGVRQSGRTSRRAGLVRVWVGADHG